MSDSVNQPRTFEVLTAAPVRARRKPRDWPNEEKERLIAETLVPGANVSAIARAEGLDPSQLYGWRRKALSIGVGCAPDRNREDGGQVRAR
ncbi:transposase [Sinorhizobium fredii]|uniref:transposase n=1 Tax=Rhizobium fredii TaxID=380 RepID=UPI001CC266A2|nr:transposase [Sinorhizobium fredii]